MNNYWADYILEELRDFHQIAGNFYSLPPPIPHLDNVWQWNQFGDGMPHFEREGAELSRFVPPKFSTNIPKTLTAAVPAFVLGMTSNMDTFHVNTTEHNQTRRDFLRRIMYCDLKKLHIADERGRLVFRKTMDDLLPYSDDFEEVALRITHENGPFKTNDELRAEMNLDAKYGWYGPGTQWCRDCKCIVTGPCVTRTPVLLWGPRETQVLPLRKRFCCGANNVVYCLHCQQCVDQGRWTIYSGQTHKQTASHNFHERLNEHAQGLANPWNKERFEGQDIDALVHGILHDGDADPFNLLQDPYTHFASCHHSRPDRRITIIDGGFPSSTNRLYHETYYMSHLGAWQYCEQTASGSLNHFA